MPIPRLEFHELPPELTERLDARVQRLGYLGEFFRCAAHEPAALAAFIDFTETSKDSLDDRQVELIALTVAGWTRNAYERHQHERLSVRLGFGRAWVAEVGKLAPSDAGLALSDDDRALQELVLSVLETNGKGSGALFERWSTKFSPQEAMAVLMVIGRYMVHGLIVNVLELTPPVPSIFEDGFTG